MSVTYRVHHRTEYRYDQPVTASFGRMALLPRDAAGQRCRSSRISVRPVPDELRTHTDVYGNPSSFFAVSAEHDRLVVVADSVVEVDRGDRAVALGGLPWEAARDAVAPSVGQLAAPGPGSSRLLAAPLLAPATAAGAEPDELVEARQFTMPSPAVAADPRLADLTGPAFRPGRPLAGALADLLAAIRGGFAYQPGTTTVNTPLAEVLTSRQGVCQDFAHLAAGCLRSLGLAARYVSGYLETDPPSGRPRLRGADASHAWVSVFAPGTGWVDLDPTNGVFVGDRHVVLAWGRDYTDVTPLKGVIFTEGTSSELTVSVDVTRVGPIG